jgi:hypothetical protein
MVFGANDHLYYTIERLYIEIDEPALPIPKMQLIAAETGTH